MPHAPNLDAVLAEIRRLYYETSRDTIARDLARAIDLLKSLPTDDDRARAAVYMDGLAEMRGEFLTGRASTTAPPRSRDRRPPRR